MMTTDDQATTARIPIWGIKIDAGRWSQAGESADGKSSPALYLHRSDAERYASINRVEGPDLLGDSRAEIYGYIDQLPADEGNPHLASGVLPTENDERQPLGDHDWNRFPPPSEHVVDATEALIVSELGYRDGTIGRDELHACRIEWRAVHAKSGGES